MRWIVTDTNEALTKSLAGTLGIHPVTAKILLNRGVKDAEGAGRYFNPKLSDIPDPFLIPDMEKGAARIALAVEKKEKIAIFGDYDADGVTGSALLSLFLDAVGNRPLVFLPDRQGEGYGITKSAIAKMVAEGSRLIITVDNGTRAVDEISYAKSLGMDVVVTDHHNVEGGLPFACAVINPQRLTGDSELRELSGCGLAFMTALAVRKILREKGLLSQPEPNLKEHLDLAALGTVADAVPLVGINRILVRHGLLEIAGSKKAGIRALIEEAGTDVKTYGTDSVSFHLAPRLNAAGRLGSAHNALSLLVCGEESEARETARLLDGLNRERQKVEGKILNEAVLLIEKEVLKKRTASIVVASENWHVGVIGIAAAKISERWGMPTAVITRDFKPARGSARGLLGGDLVGLLSVCGEHLVRFGGHAMAAGFAIEEKNLDRFAESFDRVCASAAGGHTADALRIDAELNACDLSAKLVEEISNCRPFGIGNPEPILLMQNLSVLSARTVGNGHLKLCVRKDGVMFDAIGFRLAPKFPFEARSVSLAFVPEFNTWNGVTSVQLKIRDFKISPPL